MKKHEVHDFLHTLKLPEPKISSMDRARELSKIAFRASTADEPQVPSSSPLSLLWKIRALPIAAVMVFLIVILRPAKISQDLSLRTAQNDQRLISELRSLFPGQLQAVVSTGGEPKLLMSEDVFQKQPLAVEFSKNGKTYRVLSFSGQLLDLELDGARLKFEALSNGAGEVIIIGQDFVWMPGKSSQKIQGYAVKATILGDSI